MGGRLVVGSSAYPLSQESNRALHRADGLSFSLCYFPHILSFSSLTTCGRVLTRALLCPCHACLPCHRGRGFYRRAYHRRLYLPVGNEWPDPFFRLATDAVPSIDCPPCQALYAEPLQRVQSPNG